MTTVSYNASELFVVRPATALAGNPAWANLKIDSSRYLPRDAVRGAGLYAIHFRGRLLYVGKFLGTRANPFAGDVCLTRWAKHLGTLTLRDRCVSFSRKAIDDKRRRHPLVPPLSDIVAAAELPVIIKPRGRLSSFNRALFAAENWATLSQMVDAQGLADFTLTYTRVDIAIASCSREVRAGIDIAERHVIARVRPRCNANIAEGTAGEMSLEETCGILEGAIAEGLDAAADLPEELERPEIAVELVGADEGDPADDEALATAEEAFLERLDNDEDALSAIALIEIAFDAIADAYIEFSKTNGGDLRVRSIVGPRRFFNVAAVHWQRRMRRFSAEINLRVERCLELGASTAVHNQVNKTLGSRATFDMPDAIDGLVHCLVEAAAHQRNNPR